MSEQEITCEECQEQVIEYLQSELSAEKQAIITAHIANCDHCESHYDVENHFNDFLRKNCEVKTPDEILAKIKETLAKIEDN